MSHQPGNECLLEEDDFKLQPVPKELVRRLYTHHFGMFPSL